ncbi:unnamed protein product, partial [Owenia fusiformis]
INTKIKDNWNFGHRAEEESLAWFCLKMFQNISNVSIPRELLKEDAGISLDMGGSLLKCAYYSSETSEKEVIIKILTLSPKGVLENMKKLRSEILDNIHFPWDTYTMAATGITIYKYKDDIIKILGIRDLTIHSEFDACVKYVNAIRDNLPKERYIEAKSSEAIGRAHKAMQDYQEFFTSIDFKTKAETQENNNDKDDANSEINQTIEDVSDTIPDEINNVEQHSDEAKQKAEYPYMLVNIGSGVGILKANADGSNSMINGLNRGGRSFISLVSLTTGAKKCYQEAMLQQLTHSGKTSKIGKKICIPQSQMTQLYTLWEMHCGNLQMISNGKILQ